METQVNTSDCLRYLQALQIIQAHVQACLADNRDCNCLMIAAMIHTALNPKKG